MAYVPLVNNKGEEVGREEKEKAHLGEGVLHKAFSVFVFNNKGELLMQKRASSKMLWPGYWSNTCCSHPFPGEDILDAGKRRLKEELGFTCSLSQEGHFIYKAHYKNIGAENEFCYVLKGDYEGEVYPKEEEVEEIKWIPFEKVLRMIKDDPESFTPWFKIEVDKFFS